MATETSRKARMAELYDAMVEGDADRARAVATAMGPAFVTQLEERPQALLRVTAGLLRDPDRPGREIDPAAFPPAAAAAPAETTTAPSGARDALLLAAGGLGLPVGQETLQDMMATPGGQAFTREALPLALGAGGGALAAKAIGPGLRLLATHPLARLALQRVAEGVGFAGGMAAPEAVAEQSLEPFVSRETLLQAALPAALTGARRLLPGGGALRKAEEQIRQLRAFRGATAPLTQAMPGAGPGVVAEAAGRAGSPYVAQGPQGMRLTPAMQQGLQQGGLVPPGARAPRTLTPKGVEALRAQMAAAEQQVGLGQRPGLMPPQAPPMAAPPPAPPVAPPMAAPGPAAPPAAAPPMAPPLTPETLTPAQAGDELSQVLNWADTLMQEPAAAATAGGVAAPIAAPRTIRPRKPRPGRVR